ncbi:hypothetical protein FPANT_12661 [Fusarium pseudoanthophilum]|uniref:Uncharacterized protein n=1 Tax=Fusarium pseudoanthophilum TaxID=48495 RepID=A0A8H5NNF8_9HYPO|nr:hypothetical protein FPANT_12661 [Fusarium pseudoanthophilum]
MAPKNSKSPSTKPRVIAGWKRVAWPGLRKLPLKISEASLPEPMQQISQDVLKHAHDIAKKHKLLCIEDMDDKIQFKMRSTIPTLLIVAPWSSERTPIWEKAVQEMATAVAELSKSSSISEGDIHVEIITPELEQGIYICSVEDTSLVSTWDLVCGKINERLQSFKATKDCVSLLAFFQYGVIPIAEDNPPTIYISVFDESDETHWHEVIADVKTILQSVEGWGHVKVHMEHNHNWQDIFD